MGTELDGFAVISDGAVEVAPVTPGHAPVVERGGVSGIDSDRLRIVGNGVVSRVTPVHTAVRNCTRGEGWPFGVAV